MVQWTEAVDPNDPVISGEMTIQPDVDSHVKYHWMMPVGINRVIAVLHWEDPAFEMRLTIGLGHCPHSGFPAKDEVSSLSPAAVDFARPPDGVIPAEKWFSHAGAENAAALEGKTTKLSFKAFLFEF